jgi:hypothetical protein
LGCKAGAAAQQLKFSRVDGKAHELEFFELLFRNLIDQLRVFI